MKSFSTEVLEASFNVCEYILNNFNLIIIDLIYKIVSFSCMIYS